MKKLISIVIPAYNEATNIRLIYDEVQVLRARETAYDFELVFMDNHSTDATPSIVMDLAAKDPAVRLIRLSRNFGYQANIMTGYVNARGAAAIQLDADGEDDPAMISQFLRKWEEGYRVVYGVRKRREESFVKTLVRKIYYKLIACLSSVKLPLDAGDFRLVDRRVLDGLGEFPEYALYLRGLIPYIGFRQFGIDYDRRKRYSGESKFRMRDLFALGFDGITSFSRVPLALTIQIGFVASVLSFIGMIIYLSLHLLGVIEVRGFTTLVLLQLLLAGLQILFLGVNSIYVGRIFDEVKSRPRSLIEHSWPEDLHVRHI